MSSSKSLQCSLLSFLFRISKPKVFGEMENAVLISFESFLMISNIRINILSFWNNDINYSCMNKWNMLFKLVTREIAAHIYSIFATIIILHFTSVYEEKIYQIRKQIRCTYTYMYIMYIWSVITIYYFILQNIKCNKISFHDRWICHPGHRAPSCNKWHEASERRTQALWPRATYIAPTKIVC